MRHREKSSSCPGRSVYSQNLEDVYENESKKDRYPLQ
jgi:hypothetical protein